MPKTLDEKINQISDLYEEGKDCLRSIYREDPAHRRLNEILSSLRDIAAEAVQKYCILCDCKCGFRYGGSGLAAEE